MTPNIKPQDIGGQSLLIVDDDRALAEAIGRRLGIKGYKCRAVDNAPDALKELALYSFDAVITDMQMPGLDGLSVVAMSRDDRSTPVIVITGTPEERVRDQLPFTDVTILHKPFEITQLECVLAAKLPPSPSRAVG